MLVRKVLPSITDLRCSARATLRGKRSPWPRLSGWVENSTINWTTKKRKKKKGKEKSNTTRSTIGAIEPNLSAGTLERCETAALLRWKY